MIASKRVRLCVAFGAALSVAMLAGCAHMNEPLPQTVTSKPTLDELRMIAQTAGIIHHNAYHELSSAQLAQAAIRGLVHEADPENGIYYTATELADMKAFAPDPSGLGLVLAARNGRVVVVLAVPGGPADVAGLRVNDVLYSVDGIELVGDVAKAAHLLLGKPGAIATIAVTGKAGGRTLKVSRKSFEQPSVRLDVQKSGLVVLSTGTFGPGTVKDAAHAMAAQWRQRPIKSLVLDLRSNAGGPFDTAVGLAALFLPPQTIVAYTNMRATAQNQTLVTAPRYYDWKDDPFAGVADAISEIPLVVLVDESTSAEAEMLAAALQFHHRATIVGRQTFGKSNISTTRLIDGEGSTLRITTGEWLIPSRRRLDKAGVTPDVLLTSSDVGAAVDSARSVLTAKPQ